MTIDPRLLAKMRALCADVYDDDGEDPRLMARRRERRGADDKRARQLCGQIGRALALALAGRTGPPFNGVGVAAVRPGADPSHVAVELTHPAPSPAVVAALIAQRGWLRAEAAAAIHRKRVPELVITVTQAGEGSR